MTASIVRNRARIGHLLMRLIETRAPLTLTFADSRRTCSSLLLGLDFKTGQMQLDEPYPAIKCNPSSKLKLRGRVEGSVVEFEVSVRGATTLRGGAVWLTTVPTQIWHNERRDRYRVQIPSDLLLPPATFTGRGGAFRGRLLDVSEHGAGSRVTSPDFPDVGQVLACALSLPGTRLIADVEICSSFVEAGSCRLGCSFAGLNAAQESAIARALASLDRLLLRRYASAARE